MQTQVLAFEEDNNSSFKGIERQFVAEHDKVVKQYGFFELSSENVDL